MPIRLSESAVARAGLIALAVALWRQGGLLIVGGLLPMHVFAVVMLMLTVLAGLALMVGAVTDARVEKHGWIAFAVLAVVLACAGYRDALFKATSETTPTTDAHLYMDVAARYLLQGKNPYAQSLAEAFRMYHLPLSYSTPLINGDFTDRAAYPAFSFLVLVPAVLVHAPTYLVFTIAFVLGLALMLRQAPAWARGVVIAPFLIDDTFLNFAFGGITDSVWAALLIGAALCWHKRLRWSAVLVGLACAHKQHPWFVVPYLALRLWHERGELPWRGEARVFLGIVAGVFLALNLPFFLWSPSAFIAGVTEPLRAPMVQLSDGLTVLSMLGLARMPRGPTSLIFWAVYAVTLVIYARHTKTLRDACWIFPALVLWFGYRALMSYWYLYAPVALTSILTTHATEPPADRARSWRIDGALTAALGVGISIFVIASVLRPAPFAIEIVPPLETWGTQVFELHVRVTSHLQHPSYPRFSVQSRSLQPMQWLRKDGPLKLYPGQTGDYVIKAPQFYNELATFEGARVAVSDDGDPAVRAFTEIGSDIRSRRLDALPNPDFTFTDTHSHAPVGWGFDRSDTSVTLSPFSTLRGDARLRVAFEATAGEPTTASDPGLSVVSARMEPLKPSPGRHAYLFTTLAVPEAPITFHVHVPDNANRPPYDTLYGIALGVPEFRGMLLFGEEGKGTLPSGEPFVSVPVTRGVWTTVTVASFRDVLAQLGAPMRELRYVFAQAPYIDIPAVKIELGFFLSMPAAGASLMEIGRIEQAVPTPEQTFGRGTELGYAAWRGELSLEHGNYTKAATWFEQADAVEPSELRELQAADAHLLAEDWNAAVTQYQHAARFRDSPAAAKGLGYAELGAGNTAEAIRAFEHARDLFAARESKPRGGYVDSLRGLSAAYAKAGNCPEARRYVEMMKAEDPAIPSPPIPGCE